MFSDSSALSQLQVANEKIEKGNFFVVDWVGGDTMRRGRRHPVIIVGNATPEQLQQIKDKALKLDNPRYGTAQRVILQVVEIEDFESK
jgi:hypothetical protein